ncbi:hypothetical protein [Micromonospora sp. CB01531]|uniref:hypothetical protein n=1 Tax=Micromonospora sp. CB01531 TaxID=1718947 RepID=UPI00093F2D74|nr:hypothetical protein [Micromonospora sp. CB01531]OKI49132.1 hypothetical protein A6A27_35425 [Micromonospora sp. CB01531]
MSLNHSCQSAAMLGARDRDRLLDRLEDLSAGLLIDRLPAQLCQLRELQMITTNARRSRPGREAAAEVYRRLDGLRNEGTELCR